MSEATVGTKKQTFRSNKETDEEKDALHCLNFLTKKAPYKGLGADSEEKHEPVSDIDTAVVDSLKVLDPKRPIREADIPRFWSETGRTRLPQSSQYIGTFLALRVLGCVFSQSTRV